MPDLLITSPANPRLKQVIALRTRRGRTASGLTCVEGRDELALALGAGVLPRTLFHCAELMAPGGGSVVDDVRTRGAETVALGRAAFEKVAYREGPDGFLAVVASPGIALGDLEVAAGGLILIAQAIEKPGNLGAMLRTADAAGVAAVIAADPVTDWGNPNVIRASKGTVFSVPVASADTATTLTWLAERRYVLVATTPATELLHTQAELTGSIAVAVGAEKWGLDAAMLAAATIRVRIPMAGRADSLNAATSAAIVLYEAIRQRG
ncbi:MAG: TrmH family RNA methyltransferase [Tetrasphaera sp.]